MRCVVQNPGPLYQLRPKHLSLPNPKQEEQAKKLDAAARKITQEQRALDAAHMAVAAERDEVAALKAQVTLPCPVVCSSQDIVAHTRLSVDLGLFDC